MDRRQGAVHPHYLPCLPAQNAPLRGALWRQRVHPAGPAQDPGPGRVLQRLQWGPVQSHALRSGSSGGAAPGAAVSPPPFGGGVQCFPAGPCPRGDAGLHRGRDCHRQSHADAGAEPGSQDDPARAGRAVGCAAGGSVLHGGPAKLQCHVYLLCAAPHQPGKLPWPDGESVQAVTGCGHHQPGFSGFHQGH